MPHFPFTVLTAFLLGISSAMMEHRTPSQRLYAGLRTFLGCMLTVIGGSWLMSVV